TYLAYTSDRWYMLGRACPRDRTRPILLVAGKWYHFKMINSIRRIALTLAIIGGLTLGAGVFMTSSSPCGSAYCTALALVSNTRFDQTAVQSTPRTDSVKSPNYRVIAEAMQVTSLYIVFPAILLLLGLEVYKPYFLRHHMRHRHAHIK
ncbi:MAG TPA: hypothetical protein VI981_01815, partial [Candidatus Paceibacterota bacterium]